MRRIIKIGTLLLATLLTMAIISSNAIIYADWTYTDRSKNINFVVVNSKARITEYTGTDGILTIPSTLMYGMEYPVYGVESYAFEECENIETVNGGKHNLVIMNGAFRGSKNLKTLNIRVDTIDSLAFADCKKLETVTLTSIKNIDNGAFSKCDNLKRITVTGGINTIGENAFLGCTSLTDVYYGGTYQARQNIIIEQGNEILENAVWHYSTCNEDAHGYDNIFDVECNYCGFIRESLAEKFKFAGASLTLQSNLAFNFKVDAALFADGAYENPYVVFNMNDKEVKVDTYTVNGDKYVFTLLGISPDKMKDTVTATLYATFEGVEYTAVKEYSVAEYCYSMLEQYPDNESLRTLIVDLLNYGAASQIYNGYKIDNLVNAGLTAEQSSWGSSDEEIKNVLNTKYETVDNPEIAWKGASLILLESVAIRIRFETPNIEGLTMNIVSTDSEWNIDSVDFVKLGDSYYVIFDKLGADKMSEEIFISIMRDGEKVSNTVRYSIESYAYSMQNFADQNLANLVKAMMRYGNSAKNYK